jgi:sulfate adenylyltransferase subunit 2
MANCDTHNSPPWPPGLGTQQAWDTQLAFQHLQAQGLADTKRTAERRLNGWGLWPGELSAEGLVDEHGAHPNRLILQQQIDTARRKRHAVLFFQLHTWPDGPQVLHANDARGGRCWVPLPPGPLEPGPLAQALRQIERLMGKPVAASRRWPTRAGSTCTSSPAPGPDPARPRPTCAGWRPRAYTSSGRRWPRRRTR